MNLALAIRDLSKDLLSVIDRAVSPRTGLINSLVEEPPSHEACGIRVVHAVLSPPTYYRDNRPSFLKTTERGTGAGFSRQRACWAAIGEAVERYAASIYWPDQLIRASANDLGTTAINLHTLIRAGRPEIRLFNPNVVRSWVKGVDLTSGLTQLVPAAMTYLGFAQSDDDEIISQKDSTGLACASTFEGASLAAICEVVERDVFAANWLLMRKPARLNVGGAFDRLDAAVQLALVDRRLNLRLFYLAMSFNVHVVMAVLESRKGIGVVAASASPSLVRAVEKATIESLYSWSQASRITQRPCLASMAEIEVPSDHLRYYLSPERFSIVKELCNENKAVEMTDLLANEHTNATCLDVAMAMKREGFHAAGIDLTTADVASLDLSVARVIVPGLQPLIFGPASCLAPDARRLNQWRERWGLEESGLNPHPHPFP